MEPEIIDSWKEASADLGIEIQFPFALMIGEQAVFSVLIKDFGSPNGTFILSTNDEFDHDEIIDQGFYVSSLNPEVYSAYDRIVFINTLNDWGFFGDKKNIPGWYIGLIRT